MATVKISELPAILGANTDTTDVLPLVDVSLNTTNKITRAEFFSNVGNLSGVGTITGATTLSLLTTTTSALTLDSGTTGAINIGTNANAKTITIGNGTGATSLVLNSGTGALNIGTNAIARTTTVGNTTGASVLNLQAGTGGVSVLTGTTGAVTVDSGTTGAINIGTNANAKTVTVGNTTGASALALRAGTGHIVMTGNVGIGVTPTTPLQVNGTVTATAFTGPLTGAVTGNASTATTLQTARNIGGVSFNGSADINLPGVNATGNQNTTGSAATLTTTRTIWGQNFNGGANVTGDLTGVGNITATGVAAFALGAVGTPSYTFAGDLNTGIFSPAADTIAISTNGTEDMRFHASSGVSIGNTTDPGATNLSVNGIGSFGLGAVGTPSHTFNGDLNTGMWSPAADTVAFSTNGSERLRIGSTGVITQPNATSGSGAIIGEQTFNLAANVTAFGPAIGDFFGATSAISLEASSVYEVTIYAVFTKTTAGTATWTLTASSAPTRMVGTYQASPLTGIAAGGPTNGFAGSQGATTAAFAATGSLSTAVNHAYQFEVQVQTNAATNFRLQLTQSAGTATPLAGSYYTVKKISATTGTFVA